MSKSKLLLNPSLDICVMNHGSGIPRQEAALSHSIANLRIVPSSACFYSVQALVHSDREILESFEICFWWQKVPSDCLGTLQIVPLQREQERVDLLTVLLFHEIWEIAHRPVRRIGSWPFPRFQGLLPLAVRILNHFVQSLLLHLVFTWYVSELVGLDCSSTWEEFRRNRERVDH